MQKRAAGAGGEATPVPQYPIESVDNALKLLLLLSEQPEIRLTEASEYLGVASSTAHRLLAMLAYRGFVRQVPGSKAYGPGPALTSVAFAALGRIDIRERARPLLERLHAELSETVHLGILDGDVVWFLDAIESPHAVRVASRLGRSRPAHCTSTGKALLAQLSVEELRRIYPDEALEPMTPKSLRRRADLERQLAKVRQQGYATNREENEPGVSSVSVALPSGSGPRAALNVAAPTNRMTAAFTWRVAEILKRAVEETGPLTP